MGRLVGKILWAVGQISEEPELAFSWRRSGEVSVRVGSYVLELKMTEKFFIKIKGFNGYYR